MSKENADKSGAGTKTQIEFDKTKWNTKNDHEYPYRDKMVQDLITNDKFKRLKIHEVLDLLGPPDRKERNYLYYKIAQKRLGFIPLHTKSLAIKLANDSTVEWREVHE